MSDTTNPISALANRYHEWVRTHPEADRAFGEAIEELLSDAGVSFDRVSARIKSWPSLKAKAKKRRPDGSLVYPNPWEDIHDIVGVRVTTFHSTEIPEAIKVLRESFRVRRSVDKTKEMQVTGSFGYGSHHLVLEVTDEVEDLAQHRGQVFEVQVRTVLQHAWAEFEHDIRYKRGGAALDPQVDRAFTLAAGLIELADQQFDQIAAIKASDHKPANDVELSAETLPGVLAVLLGNRFPRSRSEHYRWLDELLSANGITTVTALKELLSEPAIEAVHKAMKYRFCPGQVRLIDDLLLLRFGAAHITRTGDTGERAHQRPSRLQGRLGQLERAGMMDNPLGFFPTAAAKAEEKNNRRRTKNN